MASGDVREGDRLNRAHARGMQREKKRIKAAKQRGRGKGGRGRRTASCARTTGKEGELMRLFTRGEDPDSYHDPFEGDERVAAALRHENETFVWSSWVARQNDQRAGPRPTMRPSMGSGAISISGQGVQGDRGAMPPEPSRGSVMKPSSALLDALKVVPLHRQEWNQRQEER